MKKILLTCVFIGGTLTANAQFTTYQSVNPNVPQRQSRQRSSNPFTTYRSINTHIQQNNAIRPRSGNGLQ